MVHPALRGGEHGGPGDLGLGPAWGDGRHGPLPRGQVSGPQPSCSPLVAHFSEWGKTDRFSLYKECLRHSFHLFLPHPVVIRGPLVAHSWLTHLPAWLRRRSQWERFAKIGVA